MSLFDALAEWMSFATYYTGYGGVAPRRSGPDHASIAPYGPFGTGDGGQVYLAIQNPREWTRFCADVLARSDIADDERFRTNSARVQHRQELHAIIDETFGRMSAAQIVGRLESARVACARMNTVAEFIDHPQLAKRDCWREVDSPVGPLRALIPPVRMEGAEPVMGAIPALGQHTDTILAELGFGPETIARWRTDGAI